MNLLILLDDVEKLTKQINNLKTIVRERKELTMSDELASSVYNHLDSAVCGLYDVQDDLNVGN